MSRRKDQFEVDGGWIGAAIVTVFCPPVGLIMLFNKLRKSHATSGDARQLKRIGTSLLAAGVGLTAFGAKGGVFWLAAGGALLGSTRLLKSASSDTISTLQCFPGETPCSWPTWPRRWI